MKTFSRFFSLSILVLICWGSLIAGNTGKIVGKVSDKQTGEPLVAVNILVVGTTRGAITDIEGKYTIIGIPIGSYTVRASLIGYVQTDVSDVKSRSFGCHHKKVATLRRLFHPTVAWQFRQCSVADPRLCVFCFAPSIVRHSVGWATQNVPLSGCYLKYATRLRVRQGCVLRIVLRTRRLQPTMSLPVRDYSPLIAPAERPDLLGCPTLQTPAFSG